MRESDHYHHIRSAFGNSLNENTVSVTVTRSSMTPVGNSAMKTKPRWKRSSKVHVGALISRVVVGAGVLATVIWLIVEVCGRWKHFMVGRGTSNVSYQAVKHPNAVSGSLPPLDSGYEHMVQNHEQNEDKIFSHNLVKQPNYFSSLKGPHIRQNFPDPSVVYHNGTTYAFATNNRKSYPDVIHVQVATSDNNDTWTIVEGLDALPTPAAWQTGRAVWAPDVKQLPNGNFLLYYTDSLKNKPDTHCIGAAVSLQITGPYRPIEAPLVCPIGGAIDPAGFLDRTTGRRYILYKVDGNSLGNGGSCKNDVLPIKSTPILLQEVDTRDGTTFIGKPTQLLDRDAEDGPLIEAPAMYLSDEGIYFLFFSANCYTTPSYHTSYATSTNILGSYARAPRPLLISGDGLDTDGPGGMDILHHSYAAEDIRYTVDKKHRHKHRKQKETRMVLFHGRMNPRNDADMRKLASGNANSAQKPIKDLHLPFVRGMYSGIAHFNGRTVTLGTAEPHEGRVE